MGDRKPLLTLDEEEESGYVPPPLPSSSSSSSLPPPSPSSQPSPSPSPVSSFLSTSSSFSEPVGGGLSIKDIEAYIKMPVNDAFDTVRLDKANLSCFECGNGQTTWVSLYLGVFICLNCAGEHRSLGSHISFVRSVNLDSWTPAKLLYVLIGGNARAANFFAQQPLLSTSSLFEKYNSPLAMEYKIILQRDHDAAMRQLVKSGLVAAPKLNPDPTPANVNMQKYENATSISSDQFFNEKKERKTSRVCCC